MKNKADFDFVLASPEDDGNIGSVCRAVKNMGFNKLTIVGKRRFDRERIKALSVHAWDIFENSRTVSSLEEALEGSVLAAGVTRRRGRRRKYISYTPEEFASKAASCPVGTIALVFGSEVHGLTDRELSACDTAVHIPADSGFPSLNLSHAVQIIAYVLRRELLSDGAGSANLLEEAPIERKETVQLVQDLMNNLGSIGFFTLTGKEEMGLFFRDILRRALLGKNEAERLRDIFDKIEKLKIHRRETGSTSSST
jgi:tRNA/rRNA methyltransferase